MLLAVSTLQADGCISYLTFASSFTKALVCSFVKFEHCQWIPQRVGGLNEITDTKHVV